MNSVAAILETLPSNILEPGQPMTGFSSKTSPKRLSEGVPLALGQAGRKSVPVTIPEKIAPKKQTTPDLQWVLDSNAQKNGT